MTIAYKKLFWLITLCLVVSQFNFGQESQKKIVRQHNADLLKIVKLDNTSLVELRGNVELEHNGWFITCDLAYLNKKENYFDAYNNVKITKSDSVSIFSDTLHYMGNKDMAKFRSNVIVINDSLTLTTNILDYNTETSIGNYYQHGKLVNEDNILESKEGEFRQNKDEYIFFRDVVLYNNEYVMYTDSLRHLSERELSYFYGKTSMFGDDKEMYCNKGWYNSKLKVGEAEDDVEMYSEGKQLKAQYVFFNDSTGYNKALRNVEMLDTAQSIILRGNRVEYFKDPEKVFATDSAMIIHAGEVDSLYLHADTLMMCTYEFTDSLKRKLIADKIVDSAQVAEDTLYREFYGYYGVRFFKSDMQGKCDSLFVSSIDTTIFMFEQPVLWTGKNQLSADQIVIHTENQAAKQVDFLNSAFIIQEDTVEVYNQVKGKNLYAYMVNGELDKAEVKKNCQTVYYVKEEADYTGIYNTESVDINVYFENGNNIKTITFVGTPKTVLYPINQAEETNKILKGFNWQDAIRPKTKNDVFLDIEIEKNPDENKADKTKNSKLSSTKK